MTATSPLGGCAYLRSRDKQGAVPYALWAPHKHIHLCTQHAQVGQPNDTEALALMRDRLGL